MKNQILRIVLAIAFTIFTNGVNAQDIFAERPYNTINTSLVPKGSFQIESGIVYTKFERPNYWYSYNFDNFHQKL